MMIIQNTLTFLTKKSYTINFEAKDIIPESNEEEQVYSNNEQIEMCFNSMNNKNWQVLFD